MEELNGLSVISAVAKKLRDSIPTTELLAIYKDKPLQNISKPYAFVHQLEGEHKPALGNSGDRHYTLDIRCHPKDRQPDINSWANSLAEKIIKSVQQVYLLNDNNHPIKAKKTQWKVEQDVLHVIVNYSFRVRATKEAQTLMDNLLYGERVK